MRQKFISELMSARARSDNVHLIVGDLGYSVVEPFSDNYPNQFINIGIAEQNMAGFAAGLASEDKKVFTYSIANFPTFRCAEQIRNDIVYHELDVTIVAVGAGLSYGSLGYSHHAIEDLALMRSFRPMDIYTPCDSNMLSLSMQHILQSKKPKYLRISKDEFQARELKQINENLVKLSESLSSPNGCLIVAGNVLEQAYSLADDLGLDIYSPIVWNNNADSNWFNYLSHYENIFTLEDHSNRGGFGSYILEITNSSRELKGKNVNVLGYDVETVRNYVGSESQIRSVIKFGTYE